MPDKAGLEQKAGPGARALTSLATLHQLQLKTQCLCELPHSSLILHHHYPSPGAQRGLEPACLPACLPRPQVSSRAAGWPLLRLS